MRIRACSSRRIKPAKPAVLIAARFTSSRVNCPAAITRPAGAMYKILVVSPSWVGDTMLAQPMFARLKQRHPGCRIDVFAPPWTEALLRQMPEVHEVIANPFPHGSLQIGARMNIGRQLRAARYDEVIILPNSFKSALTPFFADIPHRTGFLGEMRYGLLTDARKLDKRKLPLMVERFAQLAE